MCIKTKANTAQTQLTIFTNYNTYCTLESHKNKQEMSHKNKQEMSVINLAMHAAHFKPLY
jgi:hypothetical protein